MSGHISSHASQMTDGRVRQNHPDGPYQQRSFRDFLVGLLLLLEDRGILLVLGTHVLFLRHDGDPWVGID